ncbi:hypothetical protein HUW46_04424 [Amycolatopsis sp. CA-230715]|nr:hypothetical protein HUW46_04424 [Amycolatopsis sp. CA-230715]
MRELADRTTFSRSHISKVLNGARALSGELAREIDAALDAGGALVELALSEIDAPVAPPRPRQLPPVAATFVGRERCLAAFDRVAAAARHSGQAAVIAIEGGPAVGKTTLAVRWAAQAADLFEGCLFADLRGAAPGQPASPEAVLDQFLRALGVAPDAAGTTVEERAATYRSLVMQRQVLVVLDNAASYEQVKPLLPAASVAVVTSRAHLSGITLDAGGTTTIVPPLTSQEAVSLLRMLIGHARVEADQGSAELVVRRCGRLPLAVQIAGEYLQLHPNETLAAMAERLAVGRRRLDVLTSADEQISVRRVLDLSYFALPPTAARMFRLLGICPATMVSVPAAAALAGIPIEQATRLLDVLRLGHLLDLDDTGPVPRYHMHHLLRTYAGEQAVVEEHLSDLERARDRLLRWYVATACAASRAITPSWPSDGLRVRVDDITPLRFEHHDGYRAAITWCDAEVHTAIALARHARTQLFVDLGWKLPCALLPYLYMAKSWSAWLSAADDAITVAETIDSDTGRSYALLALGWIHHELGHPEEALVHLRRAHDTQPRDGDPGVLVWIAFALAAVHTSAGRHRDARDCYHDAINSVTASGTPDSGGHDHALAVLQAMLATTRDILGDHSGADRALTDAFTRARRLGYPSVLGLLHHRRGLLQMERGQHHHALDDFEDALRHRRAIGARWAVAETLLAYGSALAELGSQERAALALADATSILDELNAPRTRGPRIALTAASANTA